MNNQRMITLVINKEGTAHIYTGGDLTPQEARSACQAAAGEFEQMARKEEIAAGVKAALEAANTDSG